MGDNVSYLGGHSGPFVSRFNCAENSLDLIVIAIIFNLIATEKNANCMYSIPLDAILKALQKVVKMH